MKVSVVIATRNAGRTIERCLRSVRGQNFDDLEIVVVDNSSTDDTVAVASGLADVVMTAGPERSSQRNSGAFVSSGDLLMFVDADMVLEPGVVRDAVSRFDDPAASSVVVPEMSFGDGFWARCKALEKQLALNDPAVEAARVFRRDDFTAVRGYDESLVACEDWDLADRIAARSATDAARTSALIWHDEGRLRLGTTFDKKRYYGRWVSKWLETAPEHRRQRSFLTSVPQLLRHPVTGLGLILMKLVEVVGFALGIADARRDDRRAGSADRAADERRNRRLGAAVAAGIAALMVQSWFAVGAFVSSGDNGPWMRNVNGVTRSWSDSLVGTGSTGYPSASLIESFLHDAFGLVGISDTLGQRLWYSLVLAVCAASVGFLTAAFARRGAAVAAAGLVAVLAPFHITTLPNILPIMAISSLALILGVVARVAQGRAVPAAAAAPIAVWMSPLAKNPPLLALVMAITVVAVVAGVIGASTPTGATVRRFASFAAWFVATSLFWLVPLVVHYALGTPGLTIVAETDVDAWSWTQRHSGPSNVVTLVASWVWGDPHILPATAGLARAPWSFLRWGLPLAALAAVPLAVNRRLAAVLAGVAAVLVVLSVGVNAPFGPVNRFLLDHVPGFWLFRQPMSKFGVVLVLVYAVLVGLGVDGLLRRAPSWPVARRRLATVGAALLATAIVAFSYPLYTGTVIPGQRRGTDALPPARVTVPASWYDAGDWLDEAPLQGSVMVLPLSEYYQRGTTWGYYGVDDLLWRITDRRSLYVLPGGYYESAGSSPELMAALQDAVAAGDGAATTRLMGSLGVAYLAIRTDYLSTPGRSFADGDELVASADHNPSLREERSFEHVHLYSADPGADDAARGGLVDVAEGTSPDGLADIVAASPAGTQVVADDGAPGAAVAWRPDGDGATHVFPNAAGEHLVSARPRAAAIWEARRSDRDGRFGVTVSLASTLQVDDVAIADTPPLELTAGSRPVGIEVGGRTIILGDEPVLFESYGDAGIRLLGDAASAGLGDRVEAGNCNNTRRVSVEEAGISADRIPDGVVLTAASGSACVGIAAPGSDTPMWHVTASFERIAGAATRVCLWLPAESKCAVGSPAGTSDRSGRFDFVAAPAPGEDADGASLVLYADHQDGTDPGASSTVYRDVAIAAVAPINAGGDRLPSLVTSGRVVDLAAGETAFAANPALTADVLGPFATEVSDCHDYDDADARLAVRPLVDEAGRSLELRARRHSACVAADAPVRAGLSHVTVSFDHRSIDGRGGRWCLMAPTGTCAAGGSLPASRGWATFSADIALPVGQAFERVATGSYRLYLYADGAGPGVSALTDTVVQYRGIAVRPTYPMVAVAVPVRDHVAASAPVDARHAAMASADRAVFRLDEAFADGWQIDGLPDGTTARHVRVDGWANGWVVEGLAGRSATVSFAYAPDRWVGLAVWSIGPVLALSAALLLRPVIEARRRARRRSRRAARRRARADGPFLIERTI